MKKEWLFETIEVECYAGYKGEESPRAFTHQGKRFEIKTITDRWYEGGLNPQDPRQDYFKVETEKGDIFLLRYTPRFQAWTLGRKVPVSRFSDN
jgi:thioredoxin reductase